MKLTISTSCRGQAALEYLLLCGLVAFIVFMAFVRNQNSFMSQVHNTSNAFYEKATDVIIGDNPQPINGGWCDWSQCGAPGSSRYRTCECPAPAFGGTYCSNDTINGVTIGAQEQCQGCGDGTCNLGENCHTCATDCGACSP